MISHQIRSNEDHSHVTTAIPRARRRVEAAARDPRIKPGGPTATGGGALRRRVLQGLDGLVAIARGKTPDPIPNSAVKTLSADGTASQGAEE